jgi:hypothetical protein
MGLFSRRKNDERGADAATPPEPTSGQPIELPEDGRPVTTPLTEVERTRIATALDTLAAKGVDVDDLGAIGAAYDRAFDDARSGAGDTADVVVELFGIALGEHLARHSARGWAVVTDVFGTDLGVVAARADTVIVPHNLVSARWMRGETGWVPGVIGHLIRLQPRA